MLRSGFVLFAVLWLSACATVGRQSRAVLRARPSDIPPGARIEGVPFVRQSAGYCGPATLTMAMRHAGSNATIEQVGPEVYTPGKKGTLQLDLVSASRRHGLLAVPVEGVADLLREVAAGHPVIVLENLGLSWLPRWHYALVTGYDLAEQEIVMHSGSTPSEHISLNRFEYYWSRAEYWGLVVLPPTELSATGDELKHVQAAAGIEQAGRLNEADTAYQEILQRWPRSLGALVGLGYVTYMKMEHQRAVKYLRQAFSAHPDSEVVRHNLSVAEKALGL